MSAPSVQVLVFFDTVTTGGDTFTLDDTTKGVLDSATYVLGGDTGTDVTTYVNSVDVDRGRRSLIFTDIDAGTCRIQLNNEDRTFDPLYAAGPYFGLLRPGKRVRVLADGVIIFDGRVSDWDLSYEVSGRSVATIVAEDALATLARKAFDAWTATASQAAGARLNAILNRSEVAWPAGQRDIDTGVSTLQGDSVTWGSNVLNYAQLVTRSDGPAAFFASRSNVLTFRDRHSTLTAAPVVAFGAVPFQEVGIQTGAESFYTRVTIDREGGTAQSYEVAASADDDVVTLTQAGLLLDSDAQSLEMAEYYATTYSTGDARVSFIGVVLDDARVSTSDLAALLAIELNDLVSVTWTPNGVGDPIEETAVVIGLRHSSDPATHRLSLWLGRYDNRSFFILDSATNGLLDSGSVLAF